MCDNASNNALSIARTPAPQEPALTGVLSLLPRDLLIFIVQFLCLYEVIGLGQVSKFFKNFVRDRYGYDPFAGDFWPLLGKDGPRHTPLDPKERELAELAASAYAQIKKNNEERIGQKNAELAAPGVDLKLTAQLKNLSTAHKAPSKSAPKFISGNCLAQLTVGNETVRAVNFICYQDEKGTDKLLESLGVRRDAFDYDMVTHRHAEMRLINRVHLNMPMHTVIQLARGTVSADLRLAVDKLCCVFCACQLVSLGYQNVIAGWAAGNLNWYTFSPITMFFKANRIHIWGENIENAFVQLNVNERLRFLQLLVGQTSTIPSSDPPRHTYGGTKFLQSKSTAETFSSGGKKAAPDNRSNTQFKKFKAETSQKCPKCGSGMTERDGAYGNFWGCSKFPKCKGTLPMKKG